MSRNNILSYSSIMLHMIVFVSLFAMTGITQTKLPKKIRGYKVYSQPISVASQIDETESAEASVKVGDPKLISVSVGGVKFSLPAQIKVRDQSGKVDFLMFRDFKINGFAVDIDEFRTPFSFEKNETVKLPASAQIFLPTKNILRAAWQEMKDSKPLWVVTGRVFVFGRFRKMGFHFKRVVPIDIQLQIKNPVKK